VSVSAFPFQWREPSVLQFMAEIRKEKSIDDVRETMLPIIEGVTQSGVTEEEVARARNAILKNKDLLLAESESFAIEMSEWAAMGDWRLFFVNRDLIKAVTPEQGRAVAEKYLRRNNRTIGTYIPTDQPERVEIPPVGDIQAMAAKYTPATTTLAEAEVFDPTPTNLESRARRETLTNGMKLGLLPKETRQDRVVAELRLAVANEKDLLQDRRHLNDFVADMLMRGTKQHTRQQIKDELDRLKARVQISGGTNTTGVSIETTHENLPAVVRLVIEMLREPSFDPKEFELLKEEKLAQLEQQRSEPLFLGFRAIQHHLFPKDHINYIPTVEEEIEQTRSVTLDQVRTFYQQYYGAGVATWSVVGDFDTKEFDQLCRQGLGQWTSSKPSQRVVAVYPGEAKAVNESINTPDKANALIVVGMNLAITRDDPDYPALVLANHILGGEALSSRLATRIRQKEGLSYGVSSIIQTGLQGNAGIVAAFAIAAPQNIQKVEQALFEELNKALQEGFAADEVEKGKESYLKEQKVNLARDSWLASRMNDDLVRERTFQALAEWEAKINALTARVVNQAFRKYVDPKKLAVFKAGDFAPRQ
jgi:zinc protease